MKQWPLSIKLMIFTAYCAAFGFLSAMIFERLRGHPILTWLIMTTLMIVGGVILQRRFFPADANDPHR